MRFKIFAGLALAAALILLAGCINYDQELTLNPDGSGFIMVHYNSAAQSPPGTGEKKGGEAELNLGQAPKLSFTEAEILKEYEGAPFKVRDIKIEAKDNVPNATYFIDFQKVADLNGKGVFALEGDKLKQTFALDDVGGNKVFKQLVALKMEVEDPSTLSSYKFTYKLTVPGDIIETNGTKGEDGKTVKWEYTLDKLINKDTEMTVTYKAGKAGMGGKLGMIIGIIVCVIIVVVIIILIIVLVKKKKKTPAAPKPAA